MGNIQANSLPRAIVPFTRLHMRLLRHVSSNPDLLKPYSKRIITAVDNYSGFIESKAKNGDQAFKHTSPDIIWIWQLHKLHPIRYIRDCRRAYKLIIPYNYMGLNILPYSHPPFKPSMDLYAANEFQQGFIEKTKVFYDSSDQDIMDLTQNYIKFLKLVPLIEPGKFIVPTIGIDLIWHTHMMVPEWYGFDSKRIAGIVLNHNDTLSSTVLSENLEYTAALWKKTYNEDYIHNQVKPVDTTNTNTYIYYGDSFHGNSPLPSTSIPTVAEETFKVEDTTWMEDSKTRSVWGGMEAKDLELTDPALDLSSCGGDSSCGASCGASCGGSCGGGGCGGGGD